MATDLYQTLGVPRNASEKDIRTAYRRLARKYHPDVNPGDRAGEVRFKEVNAAYEVLSDPDKRAKYDRYGDQWEHADQIEEMRRQRGGPGFGPEGVSFRFEQAGEGGDFGSIFESLFRRERGGRAASSPRRGQDIESPAEISLEDAVRGTTRTVRVGGGDRRLEVKVPAGVKTGSRVRVAGEGMQGLNGGPNGDLFLVVTVAAHPRFERKGDDLHVDVDVPMLDAVLGGEVEVQTLDGRVMLRLPELTQNGRQFRLSGKGMPVLGQAGKRGDLYARVRVHLPSAINDEERELYRKLKHT